MNVPQSNANTLISNLSAGFLGLETTLQGISGVSNGLINSNSANKPVEFTPKLMFHTISIVANLTISDNQTSKSDLDYLHAIMRRFNPNRIIVDYYWSCRGNDNHYFEESTPDLLSDIVAIDQSLKKRAILKNDDQMLRKPLRLAVDLFNMVGQLYIRLFGTTDDKEKSFNKYIERMEEYITSLDSSTDYSTTSDFSDIKNTAVVTNFDNTLAELNNLVGLDNIKHDVDELISLAKMNKMRAENGLKSIPLSLHLVFTGNPGTGKTTVARILAKLYNEIGILSQGQLIEVDRSDLVAGYVGQTAIKTSEKIKEALGGILFIDEAYTLAKDGNDFGQEAIDTLLKAMEDNRDDFIVIVAGYQAPMEKFINSNPGLKSRFNKFFLFPDYSSDELSVIFRQICKKYDYSVSDDVLALVDQHIASVVATKTDNFANAREIRNYFERIVANQALRLSKLNDVSQTDLYTITVDDLE